MVELYGYLDMETRDWVDGLFSNIFREMNRPLEREVSALLHCTAAAAALLYSALLTWYSGEEARQVICRVADAVVIPFELKCNSS